MILDKITEKIEEIDKMIELKIAKMCGCVKREKIPEIQTFENMEIALDSAKTLAKKMNETFCKKHNFQVVENNSNLLIQVELNK